MGYAYLKNISPPFTAPSPNEILETYRTSYNSLLAAGKIKPLIYPYHFFGVHLVLLYLLIPHKRRPWLYRARWVVFAMMVAFEVKTLKETRSMSMAVSYAAGLAAAWCVTWGATMLIWNEPQWDFKRVEILGEGVGGSQTRKVREKGKISLDGDRQEATAIEDLQKEGWTERAQIANGDNPRNGYTNGTRMRKDVHGNTSNGSVASGTPLLGETCQDSKSLKLDGDTGECDMGRPSFFWQSYPEGDGSIRERLSWLLDLLMNFRGPGWSWAIPSLNPLPQYITSNLEYPSSVASTRRLFEHPSKTQGTLDKSEMVSNPDARRYNIIKFCMGYLALDILKTIMMHDPYFYLGPNSYAPPTHLPTIITTSPFFLRAYRCFLTFISVVTSLETAFLLCPLFLNYLLGPPTLGLRGHDFMYPPIWGPFTPNVLDKGVAGLWGGWWHQTFRFAFSSPTSYLIKKGWIERKSVTVKIIGLIVAFGISGFLHFCGSITQLGDTNPLHPLAFFMLQGLGILAQTTFSSLFHAQIKDIPRSIRRTGNFLFTFIWLFYTSPFLIDDFASGGIWLYEPIPISLLRGMGFGREGDGWWCWSTQHGRGNGVGVGWYRGMEGRWWESGIGIY